jgi:hypothetical protein
MKQFIILILALILISCGDNNIAGVSPEPESNYHEDIQGIWQADSIVVAQGWSQPCNATYTFYEDTLKKRTGNTSYWAYELFEDSIALSRPGAGFCDMKIIELNQDNMKLLALWNNSVFYFHRRL